MELQDVCSLNLVVFQFTMGRHITKFVIESSQKHEKLAWSSGIESFEQKILRPKISRHCLFKQTD